MNFDSETMPDWFGLPKKEDLPCSFSIEYVRAWRTIGEPAAMWVCCKVCGSKRLGVNALADKKPVARGDFAT